MPLPENDSMVGHSSGTELDGVLVTRIREVSGLKMEQDVVEPEGSAPDDGSAARKLTGRFQPGEVRNSVTWWATAPRLRRLLGEGRRATHRLAAHPTLGPGGAGRGGRFVEPGDVRGGSGHQCLQGWEMPVRGQAGPGAPDHLGCVV
jgi:hypothetical protein